MEKKDELKMLIVVESLWQSMCSDVFTFGVMLSCLFVNTNYLGNSGLINFFIIAMLLMIGGRRADKKVRHMTTDEALEYLTDRKDKANA